MMLVVVGFVILMFVYLLGMFVYCGMVDWVFDMDCVVGEIVVIVIWVMVFFIVVWIGLNWCVVMYGI